MKNINEMTPAEAVEAGYDATTDVYLDYITTSRLREQSLYLKTFMDSLPQNATILDLGCGAGIPTTRILAEQFVVTGVDISSRQIELARTNVPNAQFIRADFTELDFVDKSFDGIVAFYSLFHVPRQQHSGLLKSINGWLKPGGIFVGCFMAAKHESQTLMDESFRNAPMFLSGNSPDVSESLVHQAGLSVVSSKIETDIEKDGGEDKFLWIVALRSGD